MNFKNYQSTRLSLHNHKIKYIQNTSNKKNKKSAIFFDRDGVLIDDVHYISNPVDVKILSGVRDFLRISNSAGWLNIVITNQSGISKGFLNWDDYEEITYKMINLLGDDCQIDAIYANSTPPDLEFSENNWRKPSPNMIFEAMNDFNININNSFMVGDRLTDLLCAKNAGLKNFIHVLTGHGKREKKNILNVFSKSYENHELLILNNLSDFKSLNYADNKFIKLNFDNDFLQILNKS